MAAPIAEIDITIKRGGDFEQEFTLGFDISNKTVKSQVRTKQSLTGALVANFEVVVSDATTGTFSLSLSDTVTTAIKTRKKVCYYDVLLSDTITGIDTYHIKGLANLENSCTSKTKNR